MSQRDTARESGSSSDSLPLILTKLRIPRRRPDLVARRRLLDFIHAHLDRKLLLVSAPAGFGKTTLLTEFAHDSDLPVCWYALDSFDRDLHVFLEHLIASIAHRFPGFGERSRAYLRETSDPGANLYPMVATLVQEIYDDIPEYFFLILDDHHTVEGQEQISEFLDLFVNYVDENCHLILASRMLPALPNLSLLVARRQAAGLSIDELRFTPREIQVLASQNYQLDLSQEQASKLAERTGGWITGLLLTTVQHWEKEGEGMPVRGRINVDLYDYLSKQVLDRQPPELRQFLLESSLLDDISPELCVEVLGEASPYDRMEQVRTHNLFVVEYEGGGGTLRYHDLFREFLQDTLQQESYSRYRDVTLYAAQAYASRGEWERAVSRYLSLPMYGPVIDILHKTARELFDLGRWDTLSGWIDALPEEELAGRSGLLLHRGKIYMERGEHSEAIGLYERAEAGFCAAGDRAGQAYAVAMKGYVLRFEGRYAEAIDCSLEALELTGGATSEERFAMALAYKNAGLCWLRIGEANKGRDSLHQALELYEGLDAESDVGMIFHDLGLSYELTGELNGAVEYYQAALRRWQALGNPGPWANTLNGLGVIYTLQGEYKNAQLMLDEALSKSQQAGDLRVEAFVWASLGDVQRDMAAFDRARQSFTQAADVAGRAHVGFINTYALCGLGNVLRLLGERDRAEHELGRAMVLAQKHGSDYEIALCQTAIGVLATDKHEWEKASQYLTHAVGRFEKGGFKRDLAVASLHRAQNSFMSGDYTSALADLEAVLSLASDLGYEQFLVIEGQGMTSLMDYAERQGTGGDQLGSLRARIQAHRAHAAARPEPVILVEPQTTLKIYALGHLRVELDGKVVQWPTIQSRDLFFCLLQHQGLRKEEIGALFWPEHPPRKLDGIFRSTLYRLRRAVYRESVVFEEGIYRFNRESGYWYDVEAYESRLHEAERATDPDRRVALLQSALDLYQGYYLDGVYADWCALEKERLREQYLSAIEELAGLHANLGHLRRAIEAYQSLVTEDPYREAAHRELMRCHFRLGDRAAAMRQYQLCVRILRDDLGVSPMSETEALYLQIIG